MPKSLPGKEGQLTLELALMSNDCL